MFNTICGHRTGRPHRAPIIKSDMSFITKRPKIPGRSLSGDSCERGAGAAPAALWLGYCAWSVLLGWGLSALGCLNGWGYLAGLAVGLAALRTIGRGLVSRTFPAIRRPFLKRFRKLLPALYLATLVFALLGGILYPPSNYDALSYRLPRMLCWLSEERWHWIHTSYHAVNTRGSVSEWIQIPFLLLTGSDRLLFLPNVISFALLPGLVFGILMRLGVARRVAWNWMWIFPTGYCFSLQAGSIGNDLVGATPVSCLHVFRASCPQQWTLAGFRPRMPRNGDGNWSEA